MKSHKQNWRDLTLHWQIMLPVLTSAFHYVYCSFCINSVNETHAPRRRRWRSWVCLPQKFTSKSHQKHWTVSKRIKKRENCDGASIQEVAWCAQYWRTKKKKNREEKIKMENPFKQFSHIKNMGGNSGKGDHQRQYSSCSSCWSYASSLWVCWSASCPSPSASSPPSCQVERTGNKGTDRLIKAPEEHVQGQTHVMTQRPDCLSMSTKQSVSHDYGTKKKGTKLHIQLRSWVFIKNVL